MTVARNARTPRKTTIQRAGVREPPVRGWQCPARFYDRPHVVLDRQLPSGRGPGFVMWGKSRLRVSRPGWADSESLYIGARVRVPEARAAPRLAARCWRGWWQ